jgi:hypothetical protein
MTMKKFHFCLNIMLFTAVLLLAYGCAGSPDEDATFSINVYPDQLRGDSIPGQRIVYLVTIDDKGQGTNSPVHLSVTAPGSEAVIYLQDVVEGEVAEVVVIPDQASVGNTLQVAITGDRGSLKNEQVVVFAVAEGEDDRQEYAQELLGKFVVWLATNHPELGISQDTEWTGTMVSPVWLIVSHYLFFSEEWEAHVEWHIMIPPHDWARIDLRHRFDEQVPSYAYEISSLQAGSQPVPIDLPESAWR